MRMIFDQNSPLNGDKGSSFCFFENKACQCYPCHDLEEINCMFCYCPLYHLDDCGGDFTYIGKVKDCTNCNFPHRRENFFHVIQRLIEENKNKE